MEMKNKWNMEYREWKIDSWQKIANYILIVVYGVAKKKSLYVILITRPFSLTVGPQISKLKRQKALKTASMMTPLRTSARFLLDFVFVSTDIFRGQNITKITMIPIRIAGIKNTTYQSIRSNYEK